VAVLSGNDFAHALIELGALYAGIPYAPVSPAYSLLSRDFAKLKHVMRLITPGLVFASQREAFQAAIAAAVPAGTEVVYELPESVETEVGRAHAGVGPDTIAKFLFTSGSTGEPKAVINTQRMWCSNQEMIRTMFQFFEEEPPVIVDWAPWHHTAAGNHDFGLVLYNGGSYYIDEGKPLPGAIETSVRNLRDIAPTWYFNVPRGYEMLLPYLRKDEQLRRNFFSRLKLLWFAGAGVSQAVFDEVKELAYQTCGEEILFRRAWKSSWCPRTAHTRRASRGRTSRRATGASPSSPRRRSTKRAGIASAIPLFLTVQKKVSYSAAESPRISSSPPAPGCRSGRCARASSRISRRTCATW
jgi:feruloyl-CoA synthase